MTEDLNTRLLPKARKKFAELALKDLPTMPEYEDAEGFAVPTCRKPAVDFAEVGSGDGRLRVWFCAYHYDAYVEMRKEEDGEEGEL
jgi:hypothetical protein